MKHIKSLSILFIFVALSGCKTYVVKSEVECFRNKHKCLSKLYKKMCVVDIGEEIRNVEIRYSSIRSVISHVQKAGNGEMKEYLDELMRRYDDRQHEEVRFLREIEKEMEKYLGSTLCYYEYSDTVLRENGYAIMRNGNIINRYVEVSNK